MRRIALGCALVAVAWIAGCSPGAPDQDAEPARVPAEADDAAAPAVPVETDVPALPDVPVDVLPPAPGEDLPTFTTEASSADVASAGPDAPILRAVRIGEHEGFDRIVFEFDSVGLPQWHVSYIDAPVIHCGSGQEVDVAGTAWLQVRFSGAHAHTEAGEPTSGPARRSPDLPALRQLVRTCDFEAEVTWVAGVAGRQAYRPRVLDDPSRLVIDVAHP